MSRNQGLEASFGELVLITSQPRDATRAVALNEVSMPDTSPSRPMPCDPGQARGSLTRLSLPVWPLQDETSTSSAAWNHTPFPTTILQAWYLEGNSVTRWPESTPGVPLPVHGFAARRKSPAGKHQTVLGAKGVVSSLSEDLLPGSELEAGVNVRTGGR